MSKGSLEKTGGGGAIIWLTGLSGSGKSTVANGVLGALHRLGRQSVVLDGDVLRTGLCSDLGFLAEDRAENIRRVGHVATLFADTGFVRFARSSPPTQQGESAPAVLPGLIHSSRSFSTRGSRSVSLAIRRASTQRHDVVR